MKRFLWTSVVAALALWPSTDLRSQPPPGEMGPPGAMPPGPMGGGGPMEGGGPMGRPRRDRGEPGSDERGANRESDRMSRVLGFLQSLDANNNGIIEPSEVSPDRARMLQFFAMRLGLDPAQPMPLARIREMLTTRAAERSGSPAKPADAAASGQPEKKPDAPVAKPESPPLVPGFGTDQVPGFGESLPGAMVASATGASTPSVVFPGDPQARIRAFREARFRRYDRDGSGVIEAEEWSEMRGDAQSLDRNRDGRITLEEFLAGGGEPQPPQEGSRGESSDGAEEKSGRKSYRFLQPQERLPEGLPSWFVERDRNRNGQVSMAEYASSWSDATVGEFAGYDINGDGVLTPQECLKGSGAETKGGEAPSGGPPASSDPPPPESGNAGQAKGWWQ